MEKCLQLPPDFTSRGPFRTLRGQLGAASEALAAGLVVLLFRDLAYAVEAHGRVGYLNEAQGRLFLEQASDYLPAGTPDVLTLLSADNCYLTREMEGGWFCSFFAQHNQHLNPQRLSIQKMGGVARGVKLKKEALAVEAQQHALLLPQDIFRHEDGTALDPETINRVTMLIKLCDNYLKRRARQMHEFSRGLVQDACKVLERHGPAEIDRVVVFIHAQLEQGSRHVALPGTTEQLLQPEMFARLVEMVEEMAVC